MICDLCLKPVASGATTDYGIVCHECLPGSREREEKLYEELAAEDLITAPPLLELKDFERLILKVAVHYLFGAPGRDAMHLALAHPALTKPRSLALHFKERVLSHIPLNYVSSMDAEGRSRLFYGGTYEFKRKVPDKVVFDALEKAGIVKFGGDGDGGTL